MKPRKKVNKIMETFFNNLNLNKKFLILYFVCVIIPLILIDYFVIKSIYDREASSNQYDMEFVADLYQKEIEDTIDYNATISNSINMNFRINEFLIHQYDSPYDFYNQYDEVFKNSFMESLTGLTSDQIIMYTNNPTVLSGNNIMNLQNLADETDWYYEFRRNSAKSTLILYYNANADTRIGQAYNNFRYVKKLDHYKHGCERVVVINNDVNALIRKLRNLGDKYPMYIRYGNYVLYTTMGDNIHFYNEIESNLKIGVKRRFTPVPDCESFEIVIYDNNELLSKILKDNIFLIVALVLVTIFVPIFVLNIIEKTIIKRISKLENAFGDEEMINTFKPIDNIEGKDEIASLMNKYNKMVDITNTLNQTIYKDKLKSQETDIARKNAELLALQSQINPHFLFNALESIRMHSILKGEDETAEMVGKLAIMERQNVEWGKDFVSLKKEMDSVEAYLSLQSYRFGDRLSYEFDIDEDCESYLIPKLTIVTFVENACVHGIESKSAPGWIFVRTYEKEGFLYIEIEDTGGGMEEAEVEEMTDNINNVSIETIKGKTHVGILNACLRLQMVSDNTVMFDIDSEKGVGTSVEIKVPISKLSKIDTEGEL